MNTQPKRKWLPQTKEGKKALIFGTLTIVWGLLFISLAGFVSRLFRMPGGFLSVLVEIMLFIFGLYYSLKAIFKIKERAILNLIIFILFCVVGGFWLLFAIGEILFPH
ncbi:MAG: hypothetical protein PHH01_00745 [Patescibacteria group bacterium]|nr:hypothetical protein [Patescibacteria group bacterium]MDD5566701.1 hypothetical protein [Patescibacteria group bacterium]